MKKIFGILISLVLCNCIFGESSYEICEWGKQGLDESKPFRLEIMEESLDSFIRDRNIDTTYERTFTKETLIEAVKNNEELVFNSPVNFMRNKLFTNGDKLFQEQYTTSVRRDIAHFICTYVGRFFIDEKVVYYRFSEKKTKIRGLSKYTRIATIEDKIYLYNEDYSSYLATEKDNIYLWKDESCPEKFYNDLKNHDASLPKYVIEFQKSWEEIIQKVLKGEL